MIEVGDMVIVTGCHCNAMHVGKIHTVIALLTLDESYCGWCHTHLGSQVQCAHLDDGVPKNQHMGCPLSHLKKINGGLSEWMLPFLESHY